jgi:peptidoglycan/LPS O-acetylase OafA/YrhL
MVAETPATRSRIDSAPATSSGLGKETARLDQLTSLRFVAAMMIVMLHATGSFGVQKSALNLNQGVAFFFVLSGFILTYVYPRLDSGPAIRAFYRARIARIWPAHAACFLIGFLLIPYTWNTATGVANLLLVHAWIPQSRFYFSYNDVSWSVSTELFFYLVFPLLVHKLESTWRVKLVGAAMLVIAILCVVNVMDLPAYGSPASDEQGRLVTSNGLLYANPLARLVEFVAGMCVALAWRRSSAVNRGVAAATAIEIAAVLFCIASLLYVRPLAMLGRDYLGGAGAAWLGHTGSVLAFGALIFVFAKGEGAVSRLMTLRVLVLLGEISYSCYLIHHILLYAYHANAARFAHIPDAFAFSIFLVVLFLASYLLWSLVEMPARRLLVGRHAIHGTPSMRWSWRVFLRPSRPLFAGIALILVLSMVRTIATTNG